MNARTLRFALLALAAGAGAAPPVAACTTGVASGRVTADGRPLLWKNRDAPDANNRVVYATGPGYAYLAVVNAGPGAAVWMGVNAKGFCIENSVVKDMPRGATGMGNGEFMRHALANCATVKEFEELLKKTDATGRSTQANFGVIDAEGGAAVFETGNVSHVKFDANDPKTAPDGYVVRSNFTMTGTGYDKLLGGDDLTDVYSGERYLRADALFQKAARTETLDVRYLLRRCSRDMADAKGEPLSGSINSKSGSLPARVDTASTICRQSTVSVAVFHGVRPGEDPALTTMWAILGEPAFAVAVPCWVKAGEVSPLLRGDKVSPLCSLALDARRDHYDRAGKILNTDGLARRWARTWEVEDALLSETERLLAQWRKTPSRRDEVLAFHRAASGFAFDTLAALRTPRELAPAPRPVVRQSRERQF